MAGRQILAALLSNYALLFVRILKAKRWIKTSAAWAVISWFINNEAVRQAAVALRYRRCLTWVARAHSDR